MKCIAHNLSYENQYFKIYIYQKLTLSLYIYIYILHKIADRRECF